MAMRWMALVICLVAAPGVKATSAPSASEGGVQVLIDVSGSMKRTDPLNLRQPALRLLVGLMPDGQRTGLWFFGEGVREALPMQRVDARWRKQAEATAGRIGSRDLFTDIGGALEAAMRDWAVPEGDASKPRHIILLSDGMVDISKEADKNVEARRKVLETILPALRERRIRVHTIALSEEADHELLRRLAEQTDGVYEALQDAGRLQRAFLHLFEKSAPRDTLPLRDNRFTVDPSVSELTLLVFRKDGAPPTRLRLPDKSVVDAASAAAREGWRWDSEAGRDLITITAPLPGEWRIQADVDPDNRAMVVTHLKLASEPIPNQLYVGERFDASFYLTENDAPLSDTRLLREIRLLGVLTGPGAPAGERQLTDDGSGLDRVGADGRYDLPLTEGLGEGAYQLLVRAVSPTFERELRHDFSLNGARLLGFTLAGDPSAPVVEVRPEAGVLDPERMKLDGHVACPGQPPRTVEFTRLDLAGPVWIAGLEAQESGHLGCTVSALVDGVTLAGRAIRYGAPSWPLPKPEAAAPAAKSEGNKQGAAPTELEKPEKKEAGSGTWIVIAIIVLANLLLGGAAWLGLRLWRRREAQQMQKILEEGETQ
ncbi:MAG: vWA domain-containing protein [Pseudomonadota bacterium]